MQNTTHISYLTECFWSIAVKNVFKCLDAIAVVLSYARVPSYSSSHSQTLFACLCSQLSLLSDLGFGGVLLYVDPCDAPLDRHTWHQAFRVTLNPGGNPALSKTLCVNFFSFFFEKQMKLYYCCGFNYSRRCSCYICTLVA